MRFSSFITLAALAATLLVSAPANAAILGTYSDRSVWTGQTTGVTTDNLNNITLGGGGYTVFAGGTLTRGNLAFDGFGQLVAVDGGYGSSVILRGVDYFPGAGQYFQIGLASGATAIGLDLASIMPTGLNFLIQLSTGETFVPVTTATEPALTFWGVRTDTQFNWLRVSIATGGANPTPTTSSSIRVDNIAYGSSALPGGGGPGGGSGDPGEVPEVGTILMLGTGLAALAARRRKSLITA